MTTSLKTTVKPKSRRLSRVTRLVDHALAQALPSADGSPRLLHEAMRYCVQSGGKRFRPLLCLGACQAVGGTARKGLPVACAIELIHTYSLVHDDLPAMDNAPQRRGKPSCHRKFGEATAILVGDALLTRAFELLSADPSTRAPASLDKLGTPSTRGTLSEVEGLAGGSRSGCRPRRVEGSSRARRSRVEGRRSGAPGLPGGLHRIPNVLAILRTLGKACGTSGLIGGQALDLQTDTKRVKSIVHSPQSIVKELEEIARRKTAALIQASVVAGALAGDASSTQLACLRRYGSRLGLAFQLMDDLHDGDGLVKAIGSEAVRRRAQQLINRASGALAPFGSRARVLHELADWLANEIA
jgi:geranylgeranyl diphosphate synthase type II